MRQPVKRTRGLSILLGCFLALGVILAWEAASSHAEYSWTSESDSVWGEIRKVRMRDGRWRLTVYHRGDIELSADESRIERVGPNSFLEIEEREGRRRRRLEVRPGPGGEPEIAWFVDREPAEFDQEARTWLWEVLPRIYRTTGLDAEGRVGRLLAAGGVEGVLREIDKIGGDSVQRLYFEALLGEIQADAGDLARVLRRMPREIGSDYEMRQAMLAVPAASLADAAAAKAFVEAASSIGSDYELRQLLADFLARPELDPGSYGALVEATRTLDSDYDLSEFLQQVAVTVPAEAPLPKGFSKALRSIGSDYELRKVLETALLRPQQRPEELDALLAAAKSIGSDHDMSEVLIQLAGSVEGDLPDGFFRAASSIGSDFNLARALSAAAACPGLTAATVTAILESALAIGSDHEQARFLVDLAAHYPIDDQIWPAFERAVKTIGSDQQRDQVLTAVGRG